MFNARSPGLLAKIKCSNFTTVIFYSGLVFKFVFKKSLWFAHEIPIILYDHEFTGNISLLFLPTCFLLALSVY